MARFQTYTSRTLPRTRPAQDVQDVQQRYQAQRGVTLAAANLGMQIAAWDQDRRRKKDAAKLDTLQTSRQLDFEREKAEIAQSAVFDEETGEVSYSYGGQVFASQSEAEQAAQENLLRGMQDDIAAIDNPEVKSQAQEILQARYQDFQISEFERQAALSEREIKRDTHAAYAKSLNAGDWAGAELILSKAVEDGRMTKEERNEAQRAATEAQTNAMVQEYQSLPPSAQEAVWDALLNDTSMPKALRDSAITKVRSIRTRDKELRAFREAQEKDALMAATMEQRIGIHERIAGGTATDEEIRWVAQAEGRDASWIGSKFEARNKELRRLAEERKLDTSFQVAMESGVPMMHTADSQDTVNRNFANVNAPMGSDVWNSAAVQVSRRTSIVPQQVTTAMKTGYQTDNVSVAAEMAETYRRFNAEAENVDLGLSTHEESFYTLVSNNLAAQMPANEAVNLARASMARGKDETESRILGQEWNSHRDDLDAWTDDFAKSIGGSRLWFGFGGPEADWSHSGLRSDMDSLVRQHFYANGGDIDAAVQSASATLKRTYSVSTVDGSPRMMKYAPEVVYGGTLDNPEDNWLTNQFAEDTAPYEKRDPNSSWQLISDGITMSSRGGSWAVAEVNPDGAVMQILPDRFQPDPSEHAAFELERHEKQKEKLYKQKKEAEKAHIYDPVWESLPEGGQSLPGHAVAGALAGHPGLAAGSMFSRLLFGGKPSRNPIERREARAKVAERKMEAEESLTAEKVAQAVGARF